MSLLRDRRGYLRWWLPFHSYGLVVLDDPLSVPLTDDAVCANVRTGVGDGVGG